jgi:methionyl-tRNA formyltransferase
MKILFFGTTEFSARMLEKLVLSGYNVPLVVTLPDKPSKRGRKLLPTPVKAFASSRGLSLFESDDMKSPELARKVASVEADLGIVVAFKILPKEVFAAPRLGTLNIHPSLLPDLRGPAPVRWAVIRGYSETGITSFLLTDRIDAGNILLQSRIEIGEDETYGELFERIIPFAGEILIESIEGLIDGKIALKPQNDTLVTKAPKITSDTCQIDWKRSAVEIHNLIRGLSPEPAAICDFGGIKLKLLRSRVCGLHGTAGEVLNSGAKDGLVVACGDGSIEILEIQAPGKRAMDAKSFLVGNEIPIGTVLG